MQNEVFIMTDQIRDFNQEEMDMDVDMNNAAQQQLIEAQARYEHEQAQSNLREVLRDYDLKDIISALGVSDVLDAISAHTIMDYICYLVIQRIDMREPGSKRMIFRREVLALAEAINVTRVSD
jgi:hypothetical protein